jgi:hypothetical protein
MTFAQQVKLMGRCLDKKGKELEHIQITVGNDSTYTIYTNESGVFEFEASMYDTVQLIFNTSESSLKQRVIVLENKFQRIPDINFDIKYLSQVTVRGGVTDPFEIPKLAKIDAQNIPLGSIERSLLYTTAASSNNELTTNYNVRGGSYDENLVYVNGFNIYRPFLTRSGQQEGMSFINSALVESVRFSAGGFDAQYGDKLSSVLDITYKNPTKFKGSAMTSLLGVESHVAQSVSARFNFLAAARYRSNGYLLNSLPTKGSYNPVFWDAQFLTNYALSEHVTWSVIGHFSSNDYRFSPQTQKTDFGPINQAYSFKIYFDGKEQTRFQTMMGGTSLKIKANKRTNFDFYATIFNTQEREYFDVQGQYYINELESDPSKENYGDSIAVLGIGTFLNHARNLLNATIVNVYHQGQHVLVNNYKDADRTHFRNNTLKWGVNLQHDIFHDVLSEWKMIDSAGYSIPQGSEKTVDLYETIKGKSMVESFRLTSFTQLNSVWSKTKRNFPITVNRHKSVLNRKIVETISDTISESNSRLALAVGLRQGYTSVNNEFYLTPRMSLVYYPRIYMVKQHALARRDMSLRFATGMYYQPPFYREFRMFNGDLNTSIKSQKSVHVVTGADIFFNMWEREAPFKFSAEAYYKYMWDVNPYEIDNVRTRYYVTNDVVAYAYGLDLNVHGEFVKGIESFFKVGLLSTKENFLNDSLKEYYNAEGQKIIFGYSEDQVVVDSVIVHPGYIPRPTDQLLNFGALVQDRMPGYESYSVQLGLQYGSRLPYGPPDYNRYKDTLRMKSYFRVDIGMSYDFLYKKKSTPTFWNKNFTDALLSFEVFNLLGINNVLSKQWVQDVEGKYYAIPNYLTQRRFNLKLILRF